MNSRVFHGTKLLCRLLRFVVDQSIAGNPGALKESVLGVDVFGRGPGFDPRKDPVVRVDARRLRIRLTEYYETEGAADPLVIEVPKGHYAPVFTFRDTEAPAPPALSVRLEYAPLADSVAVLPFISLSRDSETQYFSDGLTEEVITAMAKIRGLRVIGRSNAYCYEGKAQDVRKVGRDLNVRTVVEGTVRRTGTRLRVIAHLLDAADCFHLWSEAWEWDETDLLGAQKEVSESIEVMTRRLLDKTLSVAGPL
ncbi:MAG TPA: hypothetical protein VG273_17235 [Bryobacteraceae bacterium]|nr:hypothetical protein [Bryobacteraceae bacterium]